VNNTSGKPGRLVTAAALVLALLGGCKNPIVQDILWGTASLDDITVFTDESFFQLSPGFNPDWTSYEVHLPYQTRNISVRANSRRESAINYRKIDGGGNETRNESGDFPFLEDEEECTVTVAVGRSYADGKEYRVRVIRGADAYLNSIVVWTRVPGFEWTLQPLDPGYNPEYYGTYKAIVPNDTGTVWIGGIPGQGAGLRFEKIGGTPAGWQPDDGAYPGSISPVPGFTFSFPTGEESAEFRIEADHPDLGTPLVYVVKISRPGKVKQDPTSMVNFTVDGVDLSGDDVPKNAGNTVSFTADPGWGNKIDVLEYKRGSGSPVPIPPNSNNIYSLSMGEEDLVLRGTVAAIPAVVNVLYVKPGGTGTGTSWANASGNLQAMIDASSPGNEIWIARGTITPDWTGTSWYSTSSDKKNWAFVLKNNVAIYGGFRGTEESTAHRDNRDWKTNKTILSGSFGGVNAKHVVIAAGVGNTARLEGLTISGGLTTTPDGGGILINSESIEELKGAGLYCINASPFLRNVTVTGNNAANGAIFCDGSAAPWFVGVTVSGNSGGSGIYSNDTAQPRFAGCRINGNEGYGINNNDLASAILINSTLSGNASAGLYSSGSVNSIVINSLVSGNLGGGVTTAKASLYNTIVAGNTGTQVDAGAGITDSYVHATTPPPAGTSGNNNHYPVTAGGAPNASWPGNTVPIVIPAEVITYLSNDINGKPRFNGTIDLGPEEQQ
jgi:hypothetical protein